MSTPDHTIQRQRPPAERRQHTRNSTNRDAVFATASEMNLPHYGAAVDISHSGLQIRTPSPLDVGTELEIELGPRMGDESSSPILVYGHVVRVEEIGDGQYAMGVRLRVRTGPLARKGGSPLPPSMQTVSRGIPQAATGKRLDLRSAPSQMHIPRPERTSPDEHPVTFRQISRKAERRRVMWALLILLFIALLLILAYQFRPKNFFGDWFQHFVSAATIEDVEVPPETVRGRLGADGNGGETRRLLQTAQTAAREGVFHESAAAFAALTDHPKANKTERFLGRVGQAQAYGALGDTAQALAFLQDALRLGGSVHPAWQAFAKDLHFRLLRAHGDTLPAPQLVDALELAPEFEAVNPQTGLHLVVDRQQYVLTVLRDGTPLKTYPVGLGAGEATPAGDFVIASKIADPAWYGGDGVVAGGSPENPLGSRWLGLADREGPTSYGIHSTIDPDSIRQPQSRGCIRMRPEDAESVFRLCPLGTPVRITP